MALDEAWASGASVNNTNHATFIPKLWSDEIIAEYEKSLVMKPLVKSMKMTGKKGDKCIANGNTWAESEFIEEKDTEIKMPFPDALDQHQIMKKGIVR